MSIKDDIAAERAAIEAAPAVEVPTRMNGKEHPVTIRRLNPAEWGDLAAKHPPRPRSTDTALGYNEGTLPGRYPVTHITVDGEPIDAETWLEFYTALKSTYRAAVATAIWGENVYPAIKEIEDLGKAMAGKSSDSPAA